MVVKVCLRRCRRLFPPPQMRRGRCLSCHQANEKRRNAHRPTPAQRGYTNGWSALSKRVRLEEPWCRWCAEKGWQTPSQVADHIVALSKGGTSDRSNLTGACLSCNRRRANVA